MTVLNSIMFEVSILIDLDSQQTSTDRLCGDSKEENLDRTFILASK